MPAEEDAVRIVPFEMERMQSTWENQVEINLSESGVHPLTVGELLDDDGERQRLLDVALGYPQTNGTVPLRSAIAALYPGATPDHVHVTNGGSEANFCTTWSLLEPGDDVVMMAPNYMQTWGLARAFAGSVREWPLHETGGAWRPDVDELRSLLTPRTKLLIVCNPNNPTGACFDASTLDAICREAARHGTWVLSDEIYRGAELSGDETPSVWGRYERAIVTSGLSKAYGLPGLRIGWVVGPQSFVANTWAYHDYTSIAPGAINDHLAAFALAPATRARILGRTRRILNTNFPALKAWLSVRDGLFSFAPPEAGAIVYARYSRPINSGALTTRLRQEKGVLLVAGDHFGMDGYLRIGFGGPAADLFEGLSRLESILQVGTHAEGSGSSLNGRS
jgi:aspartate/methionine/tyrosine aminotransferase